MYLFTPRGTAPRKIAELHRCLADAWRALDAATNAGGADLRSIRKLEALRARCYEAMDTLTTSFSRECGEEAPRPDPTKPGVWHEFLDLQATRRAQAEPDPDDVF